MNPMTPHTPVEGLVAKWRADAAKLRKAGGRAQRRGDPADAEAAFTGAQDADSYADELEAALASLPVEGFWREHYVEERKMRLMDGGLGAAVALIAAQSDALALERIAQRQGNEPGGTHE